MANTQWGTYKNISTLNVNMSMLNVKIIPYPSRWIRIFLFLLCPIVLCSIVLSGSIYTHAAYGTWQSISTAWSSPCCSFFSNIMRNIIGISALMVSLMRVSCSATCLSWIHILASIGKLSTPNLMVLHASFSTIRIANLCARPSTLIRIQSAVWWTYRLPLYL
mgnify:CR=1 FL=1